MHVTPISERFFLQVHWMQIFVKPEAEVSPWVVPQMVLPLHVQDRFSV